MQIYKKIALQFDILHINDLFRHLSTILMLEQYFNFMVILSAHLTRSKTHKINTLWSTDPPRNKF